MKLNLRWVFLIGLLLFVLFPVGQEMVMRLISPSAVVMEEHMGKGEESGLSSVFIKLIISIVLTIAAFFYFKIKWMGRLSAAIHDFLVGDGDAYSPAEDELVSLIQKIEDTHDKALLPDLDEYCQSHAKRLRNWTEYARVLEYQFMDMKGALAVLERAYKHVKDRQDKALLLYRAGQLCADKLGDEARAQEFFAQASSRYPRTAYGKKALEKLRD